MKAAATAWLAVLLPALLPGAAAGGEELDVATVVARHLEARGGAERWRALRSMELTGTYAAFSFYNPFRLIRQRGDRFRLDYVVLDSPAVRARDGVGPWGLDPLLWPEATRLDEEPYKSQLERESLFGPVLLEPESRGIAVELLGEGEVEGQPTVDLRLTFAGKQEEVWHLDPESWLEVAIDAQIIDHTQGPAAMRRRTFFDDFREVEGLVLPFQVDHEFGARLEAMTVERVRLDLVLEDAGFRPPATEPPAAEAGAAAAPAGGDQAPEG